MTEKSEKVEGLENIREYLTLNSGYSSNKPQHRIFILSCNYRLDIDGWITYVGSNMWNVGEVTFNLDTVKYIWPASRKIWLE